MIGPKEETKDFLVILLTSVTTFFMPVYGIICALLFVAIVDHIFGIWKAKQRKETISIIFGIWSTFVKGFLYSIILLSVFAVDKQVINDLITLIAGKQEISWIFTKVVALILFAIEAYSINRNYKAVKGVSLFTALSKQLSVDVVMSTDSAQFGVTALDMPYTDTWEDGEVEGMVVNWLTQFEV